MMTVLLRNEVGWLFDHQQEINDTYANTYATGSCRLRDCFCKKSDVVSSKQSDYPVRQFNVVPELFAIHGTFIMDSQFAKSSQTNQVTSNSDIAATKLYNSLCEFTYSSTDMPSYCLKSRVRTFFVLLGDTVVINVHAYLLL